MALSNYTEIIDAVSRWLDRDDLSPQVPDFVYMAENRINRVIRPLDMESTAITPLVEDQVYYPLPCDYIEARNIYIDTQSGNLSYISPDLMSNINPSFQTGFYTIIDYQVKLNESMEGNLIIEYFKEYAHLSDTNPENWITQHASDLLLYGALLEAEAFIMTDERIPVWIEAFYKAVEDINESNALGRHSGDAMSIRAV